jgi:hypothetical protein
MTEPGGRRYPGPPIVLEAAGPPLYNCRGTEEAPDNAGVSVGEEE